MDNLGWKQGNYPQPERGVGRWAHGDGWARGDGSHVGCRYHRQELFQSLAAFPAEVKGQLFLMDFQEARISPELFNSPED